MRKVLYFSISLLHPFKSVESSVYCKVFTVPLSSHSGIANLLVKTRQPNGSWADPANRERFHVTPPISSAPFSPREHECKQWRSQTRVPVNSARPRLLKQAAPPPTDSETGLGSKKGAGINFNRGESDR